MDSSSFLPKGDIVIRQIGPWNPIPNSTLEVHRFDSSDSFVGEAGVHLVYLRLEAPASIGGQHYAFKSVQYCRATTTVTIDGASVIQHGDSGSTSGVASDGTDRPPGALACYLLADPTPSADSGGITVSLGMTFPGPSEISIRNVETTWAPIE